MKKCRITVMRITRYEDLMARYENPIPHPCGLEEGQVFTANGWEKPAGLCHERMGHPLPLRDGPVPRGGGAL